MNRALFISGSHLRHRYFFNHLFQFFDEILLIEMKRENVLPTWGGVLDNKDAINFERHFSNREAVESRLFGDIEKTTEVSEITLIQVEPHTLNSKAIAEKIKQFSPEFGLIFGSDLIRSPVLEVLPFETLNLHLGLSPWYRGSATLFWPFVFLEPQFAGITFHRVIEEPDAGDIVLQLRPNLEIGDGVHDVGAKCVQAAKFAGAELCKFFLTNGSFYYSRQPTSGRLWRINDFHPSHLRIIYNLFDDDIVDAYLAGQLSNRQPTLINTISLPEKSF